MSADYSLIKNECRLGQEQRAVGSKPAWTTEQQQPGVSQLSRESILPSLSQKLRIPEEAFVPVAMETAVSLHPNTQNVFPYGKSMEFSEKSGKSLSLHERDGWL